MLPGQPCRNIKGIAVGEVEKRARKWIVKSEPEGSVMGIVKFGNELMWSSHFLLIFPHVSLHDTWVYGLGWEGIIPIISCFPMFLCIDKPVSVHTESAVCLLVFICCRTNLRMGK